MSRTSLRGSADETSTWDLYGGQWSRHLRARNVSPRTVEAYSESLQKLVGWAIQTGYESPLETSDPELEAFFEYSFATPTRFGTSPSASTVAMDYRHLKVFFRWLSKVEDVPNAMENVAAPIVPEKPVPVFSTDDLQRLLRSCDGKGFADRRDKAIIRVLLDAGIRRGELAGITMTDLNVDEQIVRVFGKGRRERMAPYGAKTAEAIDAYLRVRMKHKSRKLPNLWLADEPHSGPLKADGVRQMLKRRARAAGVDSSVYAHRFRHTAAHMRLDDGLSEGDAMRIFGWKSRAMVDRYGASAANARALRAARSSSPADSVE